MNKQQFIQYLEQPFLLGDSSAVELDKLIKEYPYFQTAHLLYLKNLHRQNSIHYNDQLKVAAAYCTDRNVLYELIKSDSDNTPSNRSMPLQAVAERMASMVLEEESKTVVGPVNTGNEVERKLEALLDKKLEAIANKLEDTTRAIEEKIKEKDAAVVAVVNPQEEKKVEEQSIEQPNVADTASQTAKPPKEIPLVYSIEQLSDQPSLFEGIDAKKLNPLSAEAINKAIEASVELEMSKIIYEDKVRASRKKEEKEHVASNKPVDKDSVLSFADWLKNMKRDEKPKEQGKQQMLEIIDKFIQDDPKRSRPKAEFYSSENMAKKSVELNDDLITETLAHIFVKQKNYPKAIRAYEVLAKRYPDKKEYYSNIIKEVRRVSQAK